MSLVFPLRHGWSGNAGPASEARRDFDRGRLAGSEGRHVIEAATLVPASATTSADTRGNTQKFIWPSDD